MTHLMTRSITRLPIRTVLLAAALGLAAAVPAQAFTVEDGNGTGQVRNFMDLGSQPADPDEQVSHFNDGQTTVKRGNTTVQFGPTRSFDQRYDSSDMFNPFKRDGRQ